MLFTDVDGKSYQRKPNLIAIIYGGTEVIRRQNENITMNASLSYDPAVGLGNHSGMNFTWRYGEIKNYSGLLTAARDFTGINLSSVHYIKNDSGREVTFHTASSFFHNLTTLVVKLVVAKDNRSSSDHQVIHLVKGDPPQISQRYESCFIVYQSCYLPPGLQSAFDPRSAVCSLQSLVCSPQSVVYLTAQRTLYNNQISADALIGQSAMGYCAILGKNSPAAPGLRILLVFYQHPAWFISLYPIETCGLLLK